MKQQTLLEIYERLYRCYGPQQWWPGETRFEIIVGAILTQNTNWTNVEKAIAALKQKDLLCPAKLTALPQDALAELIRPAGYFNIKAKRLKNFLAWLQTRFDGDVDALEALSPESLREHLLSVSGIGPETADSICLYAYHKPVFVVDAYTARIFGRHGLIEPPCGYDDIQALFHAGLEKDPQLFNEFHALIVRLGKEHCKPGPICRGCPLEDLPHRIEPDVF